MCLLSLLDRISSLNVHKLSMLNDKYTSKNQIKFEMSLVKTFKN